jgi:phage portal protein BeeE
MTDQSMHFALVMDLIEGRKFARDEGALVVGVNKEDPADKIRGMLEQMGGREIMDKASLVNEALMAAKAGADTSMYAEMLK